MSPSSLIEDLLASFDSKDEREKRIATVLREQVALRSFHPKTGKLVGPALSIADIARHANIERNLVCRERCELPRARELMVNALELLSEYSLQVQCEFLKEENKALRARLDRKDSIAANRVVTLFKQADPVQPTPTNRFTADDVRKATVVPMDKVTKGL